MKELTRVVIVTALLIGATAVSIHGFRDRELFVPAKTISSTKEQAVVSVHLRSAARTDSIAVTTIWTGGEWRVVDWFC